MTQSIKKSTPTGAEETNVNCSPECRPEYGTGRSSDRDSCPAPERKHCPPGAGPVIVTGFDPFGGNSCNPSGDLALRLHGWQPCSNASVIGLVLPCAFGAAIASLAQAIAQYRPALVIALGLADNRNTITVERVAINVDDARIPDNDGRQPVDEPVIAHAPAAYFSTLPIKAIVATLQANGIPASVSQTAGTFVCNHVFFGLSHLIATRYSGVRGGFIHVPCTPEMAARQPGTASMSMDTMEAGIRLAVQTCLTNHVDLRAGGGAIA